MASKKAALGKGLSALLPSQDDDARSDENASGDVSTTALKGLERRAHLAGRVAEIQVEAIQPNPYQPRTDFNDEALDELAASITQLGMVQPVTVRAREDNRFELISGERRLRAARRAGLARIPAYIREADSEEMLEMALVENLQREELNPIEVALGYQRLMDECGLTQAGVAERVSKSRSTVTNFLRLLKLPPPLQAALRDQLISVGHARALITLDEKDEQVALLEEILKNGLSVRKVEKRVREIHTREEEPEEEPQPTSEVTTAQADADSLQVKDLTDRLRAELSTRVTIRRSPDGSGKIEIDYYSDEDLERLSELLLP